MVELNLSVAKAALDESANNTQAALSVKDAQELLAMQANLFQPLAEKTAAYSRHLYDIASGTNSEFTKAFEAQAAAAQKQFASLVDSAAQNAPAGSEQAVAMMKGAVTAANTALSRCKSRQASHRSGRVQPGRRDTNCCPQGWQEEVIFQRGQVLQRPVRCKLSPRISLNFVWETGIPSRADRKISPFFILQRPWIPDFAGVTNSCHGPKPSSPLFKLGQTHFQSRQRSPHGGSARFNGPLACPKISAFDPRQSRTHHPIGLFERQGVDAFAHDGEGLHQDLESVAIRLPSGSLEMSTAITKLAPISRV